MHAFTDPQARRSEDLRACTEAFCQLDASALAQLASHGITRVSQLAQLDLRRSRTLNQLFGTRRLGQWRQTARSLQNQACGQKASPPEARLSSASPPLSTPPSRSPESRIPSPAPLHQPQLPLEPAGSLTRRQLQQLVRAAPVADRLAALSHPQISPSQLTELSRDAALSVRLALAALPQANRASLLQLARDPHPAVRMTLAARLDDPAILARLARDAQVEIRRIVAERPLKPSSLARLAKDPDAGIRRRIACREDLPPTLQAELARDPDGDVRAALAGNPGCVPGLFSALADDALAPVQQALLNQTRLPFALREMLTVRFRPLTDGRHFLDQLPP